MIINLLVVYPLTKSFFINVVIVITTGNITWMLFLLLIWLYISHVNFEKMPKLIRFINRHIVGFFLLITVSGIVLLTAQTLDIFPVLIKIFPVQLLLWILIYTISFQNEVNRKIRKFDKEEDAIDFQETAVETKKELIKTITVKTGKRLCIIPVSEVVCFQAYGDYVNIMTLQGIYLKEQTLKYFSEHLPEEQFLRVHRSYIVNINAIETIERYGREKYLLLLRNKEKIKATLEGYKTLKVRLGL
jgi:hypothetical protein